MTIDDYRTISNQVWKMFKNCFPEDGSADKFVNTASEIGKAYKAEDEDKHAFFVELTRVYMHVLIKRKG